MSSVFMPIRRGAPQKQQRATTETLFDRLCKQIQTTGIQHKTIEQINTLSQQQANMISRHLQGIGEKTYDPFVLLLMLLILNKDDDSKWKKFLKNITKDRLWDFYTQFINPPTFNPNIDIKLNSYYFEIIFNKWLEENPESFTIQHLQKITKSLSVYRQKLMKDKAWILLGDLYDQIEKSGILHGIIDQINRLSPDQKKYIKFQICDILNGMNKSDKIKHYYILVILYCIIVYSDPPETSGNYNLDSLHEFLKTYKINRLLEFYRRFINPENKQGLTISLNFKYFLMVLKEWLNVNKKTLSFQSKMDILQIIKQSLQHEVDQAEKQSLKTYLKEELTPQLNQPDRSRQQKLRVMKNLIPLEPMNDSLKTRFDTEWNEALRENNLPYLRYILF